MINVKNFFQFPTPRDRAGSATVLGSSKNVLKLILQCSKNVKFLKVAEEFLKKNRLKLR